MDDTNSEEYIGSSKFDKLRRVSIIKPVAEKMGLREGDEVSFYSIGSEIVIRKRLTQDLSQDQIIRNLLNTLKYDMEFYYDEEGKPAFKSNNSEGFDHISFEKLDKEHQDKLMKMIYEEVAKKVNEYNRTHNR